MQESKITAKGQTTLPKHIRDALDLKPGDTLRYISMDGEVRIVKAKPVTDLSGVLRRPDQRPVSLEDMEDAIQAGARE